MLPRCSTWSLERYFGRRPTVRPSLLICVLRSFTNPIAASKHHARLLSVDSNLGAPPQRQWPWYLLTFAGGFGSTIAYNSLNELIPDIPLNPRIFSPYTLVSMEQISSTGSIFTLRPTYLSTLKDGAEIYKHAFERGIWSVEIKQPQLQISRAYTPLPPSNIVAKSAENVGADLRFFIRRDPKGEVSGYLHNLPEGAVIDLRGPHLEYNVPDNVGEVLFLAGGTGIAPALQAVQTLLLRRSNPNSELPKIRILWANRRRDDCKGGTNHQVQAESGVSGAWGPRIALAQPQALQMQNEGPENIDGAPQARLVGELMALEKEHPGKLSVEYFVDEESVYISEAILKQRISATASGLGSLSAVTHDGPLEPGTGRKLLLISGPDGFVEYFAGPKVWEKGKEGQGNLGGVLKKLDLRGWDVWKL
ncbi:hypothetical protein MMC08_002415 [Hypocenomyce scalaris]|nr:hypothetical protein [Hypocenomyce scalaris]